MLVMRIGYTRAAPSDLPGSLETQTRAVQAAGCVQVFREQAALGGERAQLKAALAALSEGDTLVVTRLDRLARSSRHLFELMLLLESKNADLQILEISEVIASTDRPHSRILLAALRACSALEQTAAQERKREALAWSQADGRCSVGRKPTARAKAGEIRMLYSEGLSQTEIAKRLGISKASVSRLLKPS